jgi:hypothetical protein
MVLVQYKQLLRNRGISRLSNETISQALQRTGGAPTELELEKANTQIITSLQDETRKLKEDLAQENLKITRLENRFNSYQDSIQDAFTV